MLSCLFALCEEGAGLHVPLPHDTDHLVLIKQYTMAVFNGATVHGGIKYSRTNTRLFMNAVEAKPGRVVEGDTTSSAGCADSSWGETLLCVPLLPFAAIVFRTHPSCDAHCCSCAVLLFMRGIAIRAWSQRHHELVRRGRLRAGRRRAGQLRARGHAGELWRSPTSHHAEGGGVCDRREPPRARVGRRRVAL